MYTTWQWLGASTYCSNYNTEKYARHDISVSELNIYTSRTSESLVSIYISKYVHLLEEQCPLFAICRSDSMVCNKVDHSLPLRHFPSVIIPCATVRRTRVWLRELGALADVQKEANVWF